MNPTRTLKYLILTLVCSLPLLPFMYGCSATGCTDNQNSVPLAGFYSYQTGQAISVDSIAIGGVGAPGDSLLLAPSQKSTSVYLPFRATQGSTTFQLTYMQKSLAEIGAKDQITFYYEARPWFASEECGAMYHYRITRVMHTYQLLDSVGVTDSLITNVERQTIQLFFRTSTDEATASASAEGTDS